MSALTKVLLAGTARRRGSLDFTEILLLLGVALGAKALQLW